MLIIGKYSLLKSQFRWQQFQATADTGFNSSHEMRGAIPAVRNTGWQQHMNRRQELWPLMIVQWVVECRGKSNLGSTEENEMSAVEKKIFNWNFYFFQIFDWWNLELWVRYRLLLGLKMFFKVTAFQWLVEYRGKPHLGSREANEMSAVEEMIFNWHFCFSNFRSAMSQVVSKSK